MLKINELVPSFDEHCCLVGQTGTGKTTLAENLLMHRKYVVILDPKGNIGWPGYRRFTKFRELVKNDHLEKIIYAPIPEELLDDRVINGFFRWIYERRNCAIYVDELAAICDGDAPDFLRAILTRGREFNLSCYMATQRPVSIPLHAISEAKNFYIFHLNLLNDRRRLTELTPVDETEIRVLKPRQFLWASALHVRGPLELEFIKTKQ